MITRRDFIRGAGAAFFAVHAPSRAATTFNRPNILIVITDELSADAASYRIGTRYLHTPNMDAVAARGRVYTRAYCSNPLCVPSRTSMFTGQYPTVTGVMDNSDLRTVKLDFSRIKMLGKIFADARYETAYFGKWHIPCPTSDTAIHGFATAEMGRGKYGASSIDTETTANTAGFLHQRHDAPFLAVASFLNPHNICEWAREQRLPLGPIGAPPSANQCPPLRADHLPQKYEPEIVALMRRSYQAAPMFPVGNFDDAKWRQYEWAYYRLIEKVDAQIGIVLQALRHSGHERDTLIVMLADHGDCQGAHLWNQKTVFYEEASRVPFVLSYPAAIKPGTSKRLVNTGIDLIPTLCDFAGIAPPPGLPGLSVKNGVNDPRKYVVVSNKMVQGAPVDGSLPTATGRMLRAQRYKYCAYNTGKDPESLVDLWEDPGEMVNLAVDPRFKPILDGHRAMLSEWCRNTHDSFKLSAEA